jgi:hypothetical protein
MNATVAIPIVTPDAGDPKALSDPTSAASIMKKAREQQSQTGADTKYDSAPPERIPQSGFQDYGDKCFDERIKETGAGLFLSLSVLLLLYAAA